MKTYIVKWQTTVRAENAIEAAREAFLEQQVGDNDDIIFEVAELGDFAPVKLDLGDIEDEKPISDSDIFKEIFKSR